jgi:hypothetical protein
MTRADIDALRDRLHELRADAMHQLVEALPIVDLGLVRIVADVTATLAALDAEPGEPPPRALAGRGAARGDAAAAMMDDASRSERLNSSDLPRETI